MRGYGGEYALAPVNGTERAAAAFAHAGAFLFMPFVLPLCIWAYFSAIQPSSYVRHQALQAMLFHLIVTVATSVFVTVLAIAFFGSLFASALAESLTRWLYMAWPVTIGLGVLAGLFTLWSTIVMVVAVVKAAQGKPYRMPIVGGAGLD